MTSSKAKLQPTRAYAGISFRPEVLQYLDLVAQQAGMSRSWVVNAIVLEHAKLAEADKLPPLLSKEAVIHI
ncbi:MAG TPA: hypothetical protein VF624_04290 [Tepidisphaeraceae bacterium]|jgi:hypothetical protein